MTDARAPDMYDCMYGRDRPGTVVALALGGQSFEVTAGADGWWFHVVWDDAGLGLHRVSR